ncbi:MAG: hypothetical protein ACI4HK_06495 [Ruminococcus sp.]
MADIYGVSFEGIAVFANGYDEGFYQGMKARTNLDKSQYNTHSMKVYHMAKQLLTEKVHKHTLFLAESYGLYY